MARELSQAELLDFLCQAGGRVANAALLGHFKRFLRDPEASPAQLQHRRERFKGFVNAVATVRQEAPGAPKFVVLRKRYRELVGEEPKPAAPEDRRGAKAPPPAEVPAGRAGAERASGAHRGGETAAGPRLGAERAAQLPAGALGAAQPRPGWCLPCAPGAGPGAPLPARPPPDCCPPPGPCALAGGEERCQPPLAAEAPAELAACPRERCPPAAPPNGCHLPVGEMGLPPSPSSSQQRILDWIVTHHSPSADCGPPKEGSPPFPSSPVLGSPESQSRAALLGLWQEPSLPVFRSIRCQLSLEALEEYIEQASSATEEGSLTSKDSDSCLLEGDLERQEGGSGYSAGRLGSSPPANGLVVPPGQDSEHHKDAKTPPHLALLHQIAGRAAALGKAGGRDSRRQSKSLFRLRRKDKLPPPNVDAALSPRLVPRQEPRASAPCTERLAFNPTEHRSSLVPLDPREHTWLVKVAAGSWMQARALFLEDPYLAIRKDFISGFTVLHWLAKHGNAQVLQDFVAGAKEAGITLDVNVRSGCGYTPLHLAAIHSHLLVIKTLVQRLQCKVHIWDSSGKKPWQYLSSNVSGEIWQLLGGPQGRAIFPAHPIARASSSSPARKVSRKSSLAAYLKPQPMKWKRGSKWPPLKEIEEYSD